MRAKKGFLAGWLMVAGVAGATAAQEARWATATDPVAQSLIEMERQWAEDECTHSLAFRNILADDFAGTAPDGKRYTKAQAIEEAEASKVRARACLLHDVDVHFFGDSIALAYGSESWFEKTSDGSERKRCLVWTDTWLRRSGRWQIVAAQDMPLVCE